MKTETNIKTADTLSSQEVSFLRRVACMLEMRRSAEELGYKVYKSNRVNYEAKIAKIDYSVKNGMDLRFSITAGRALGSEIMTDIFTKYDGCGLSTDYVLSFNVEQHTDNVVIVATHKMNGEVKTIRINVVTKSKTGSRFDGLLQSDNTSFIESMFANTPLLKDGVALQMVNDSVYRSVYEEGFAQGIGLGALDNYVREQLDLGNGADWKKTCTQKLVAGITYALNQPEFTSYTEQIQQNILNLAGYKTDSHFAMALRKTNHHATHLLTTIDNDIYDKFMFSDFGTLKVVIRQKGTFHLELDKFRLGFTFVPGGMKLLSDPIKTFIERDNNLKYAPDDAILVFNLK